MDKVNKVTVTFEIPGSVTIDIWPSRSKNGAPRRVANVRVVEVDGATPAVPTRAKVDGDMIVAAARAGGVGSRVSVSASKASEVEWTAGKVSGVELKLTDVDWTSASVRKTPFVVGDVRVIEIAHSLDDDGDAAQAQAQAQAAEAAESAV